MLFFVAWLCLILYDLQEDYPLFNPQNSGTIPHSAYYLCYKYPRPQYWIHKGLDWIAAHIGKEPPP